jgi:hypothetical protein
MFLLDTNTISHLRNPRHWTPQFAAWERQSNIRDFFISAISEFEIQHGIERVQPKDPNFATALQRWFDHSVRTEFQKRTIPVSSEICRTAASLALLPTRDLPDLLISATALVHDLTVVTQNVKHFHDTGVRILNPWQ